MLGGSVNVGRAVAFVALVALPVGVGAVPVTWEARGVVEFSDLGAEFFATHMPQLAGTRAGEQLVLRITFDTDATFIRETSFDNGGRGFTFDGSLLRLALTVPGRGTQVFSIDDSVPPDTASSIISLIDDRVTPELPVVDGVQFRHDYYDAEDALDFTVLASFASTDTSIVGGATLPLAPHPTLVWAVEHEISILDHRTSRSLIGVFTSLVRLPTAVPTPDTAALLVLGLVAFGTTRRRRTA